MSNFPTQRLYFFEIEVLLQKEIISLYIQREVVSRRGSLVVKLRVDYMRVYHIYFYQAPFQIGCCFLKRKITKNMREK